MLALFRGVAAFFARRKKYCCSVFILDYSTNSSVTRSCPAVRQSVCYNPVLYNVFIWKLKALEN